MILFVPGVALARSNANLEVCATPASRPADLEVCATPAGNTPGLEVGTTRVARQQAGTNVNARYEVESASVSGVGPSAVSQALRDDMQKLVGNKYDPEAAELLAGRLRKELPGYRVSVKVRRGDQTERVKVVFEAERIAKYPFELRVSPLLYTTNDAFSLSLLPGFDTHHNYFSFGLVTNANDLLERNSGVVLRYEHRKVGTSIVQVGVEYDYFWPEFQPETEAALALAPGVPGTYDTREVFTPSISLLPVPDLKVTFGASFQTLGMQFPAHVDQAAHALIVRRAISQGRAAAPRPAPHHQRRLLGSRRQPDARERLPLHAAVGGRGLHARHAAAAVRVPLPGRPPQRCGTALRALLNRQRDDAARLG